MKLLLDTCAMIWWTLAPDRLSPAAAKAIEGAGALLLSSISIWELGIKVKRNKLQMPYTLREYTEKLRSSGNVCFIPVDEEVWVRNLELAWDHDDPADRTLVATALLHDLPLVTADKVIAAFYPRVVW